jgi:hypothetical protein
MLGSTGMLKKDFKGSLVGKGFGQVLQDFRFPAIQTGIIDFDNSLEMAGSKDEFLAQVPNLCKHFLVI